MMMMKKKNGGREVKDADVEKAERQAGSEIESAHNGMYF